ncbi:MAG: hypothetical protein JRH08_00735 [Deltaproteobacteria bacterium]|nr:hypothetical protein [Deltaproteobacteria bacterium]MBW2124229.1 hypothetical protein [Deltaproteobacteria bacterium]
MGKEAGQIIGIAGAVAGIVVGGPLGFAIAFGSGIVGGLVSRSDIESPKLDATDLLTRGSAGLKLNTRSTSEPLKIVYGQLRVGGNDIYIHSTGDDLKDLWIVQTLSEGECDSITAAYLGDKLYSEYGGNAEYWFHSGSSSQTYDTNLHTADSRWTDNLRYTCYIVWHLTYDRDYFQNLPQRTVILKGRKLYDFRDSTTAWSQNPVLIAYDWLTNSRYGLGKSASQIDTDSWTAAANYCDTKGWKLNLAVSNAQSSGWDILKTILLHARLTITQYDGKYYLYYADTTSESTVMDITDEHIVQGPDGKAMISVDQDSMWDRPDGLRVYYIKADNDEYVEDSFFVGEETGNIKDLRLTGFTDRETAGQLATYWLERWQLDRTISLTVRDDAVKLEPHDLVTLTSSAISVSNQLMRVAEANIRPDGFIDLKLQYESDDLYDDEYNINTEETYTTTLPDPTDEPPSVGNVTQSEEVYYYRLRSFTRWKISFDEPANYPWFSHVEVWWSTDDSNYKHLFDTTNDFAIDPVEEGETHYVKLRTVSIWGTKQSMSNAYKISRTIQGKTDAPTSLSALHAIVNANTINLYAEKVSDPDVELYEFRLGPSWSGAIFLAALRAPNLSLYGVKPGEYTFFANTLANNGEYGDTPKQASASLQDPPDGWTVQHTEACDYSSGTHNNTEQTTYNSEYYLKCSHSSGNLTGTYTSPVYDLGSSGRYMVYVLVDIVVTGAGTTWNDVIPPGTTWDEIGISSKTWNEIFELNAGPQVKIKLKYGETNPPTNEVEKMEILSAIVTGRYFQVEIEITDPSDAVNVLVEHFTLKFCQ